MPKKLETKLQVPIDVVDRITIALMESDTVIETHVKSAESHIEFVENLNALSNSNKDLLSIAYKLELEKWKNHRTQKRSQNSD